MLVIVSRFTFLVEDLANISAQCTWLPVRFLQKALVVLVLFAYFPISVFLEVR